MSIIGYPVTYVVTSQTNQLVEAWMNRMRLSAGIEIVHRRNAVKGVLSALKRNRAVAILCDQDAGESGVMVPFFNRLASTPRGPALFHLKTGTPILFCAAPREKNGRYTVKFDELTFEDLTGDPDGIDAARPETSGITLIFLVATTTSQTIPMYLSVGVAGLYA